MAKYIYKTQPLKHQRECLIKSATLVGYGLFWEPGCVDSKTEFLSPAGWVPITEWDQHEVAQWNADSGRVCFAKPSRYIALPHDGPMLRISGRAVPEQLLCPDHNIPILDKRGTYLRGTVKPHELVEQLTNRVIRRMPAAWHLSSPTAGIPLSDADLRLQVAIMADGHFSKGSLGTNRVIVRLKRTRKIERLRELLAGRVVKESLSAGYTVFSFTAPLRIKRWPVEWYQATQAQRLLLLEELVHWDGTAAKNNRGWAFCSKHESDVDLIQFLASAEGLMAHKSHGTDGIWYLHTRGKSANGFSIKKENIEWVGPPADGMKYCFTTETGFWIVRRDGYVYPTGNCGKTFPMIANFCWLLEQGIADTLLVVAPNGVHRNWVSDEIPIHMPDRHRDRCRTLIWKSSKLTTKKYQKQIKETLAHDGPVVVVVNYESVIRKKFKQFAARLLKRKVFMVLDESHRVKSQKSHVKLTLTALGKYAKFRRILTGTPLEKPEDIYTQIRFLDPDFWPRHGFRTPTEFRMRYCVFRKGTTYKPEKGGRPGMRKIEFMTPVGAKNLEELQAYVAEIAHRLTKDDAGLDLPPKLYSKRYCELSPEQSRVYSELKNKYVTQLRSGALLKAELPIVRLLRLQQIAAGYVACEADQPVEMIEKGVNHRLDLCVEEILRPLPHQAIVWSRFNADIDQLCAALGKDAVRYDGQVKEEQRALNKLRFQKGDAKYFVGKITSGGTGLTLIQAKTMVYYENYFSLIPRLQADDRFHRVGQTMPVNIIDIICENTVDEYIVDKLRAKFDIATQVTGDAEREWL